VEAPAQSGRSPLPDPPSGGGRRSYCTFVNAHPIGRRATLAGLLATVVLAAGAPAGAATSGITVTPSRPVTGTSSLISVRLPSLPSGLTAQTPLYMSVTAPFGGIIRTRMTHLSGLKWKTAFSFAAKGKWKLRVVTGKASSKPLWSTTIVVHAS
jgi:hypothetical protein